jgi:hypothetical protein
MLGKKGWTYNIQIQNTLPKQISLTKKIKGKNVFTLLRSIIHMSLSP